jgi:hypothetical protein
MPLDENSHTNLPDTRGVRGELPFLLGAFMLHSYSSIPHYVLNDGSPYERTYGSDKANRYSPDDWKIMKHDKIGRNDTCTCGSGKKYKKCCGAK